MDSGKASSDSISSLWTSKSSKELLKTRIGSVRSERCRCARTGAENDFITFEFPDWVNVIAETPEGAIVMIRQYRAGTKQVELEVPGGCMEASDAGPVEAAARELLEETGYAGERGRVIGSVCPNPALQGNACFTVKFENARKTAETAMDEMEAIETHLVPKDELQALASEGSIAHGLVLNALLFHWLDKAKGNYLEETLK